MSEAEKTILTSLLEKVNKMGPQDAEAMLLCAAAYKAWCLEFEAPVGHQKSPKPQWFRGFVIFMGRLLAAAR